MSKIQCKIFDGRIYLDVQDAMEDLIEHAQRIHGDPVQEESCQAIGVILKYLQLVVDSVADNQQS